MTVVLATLLLTHWALAIAVMPSAESFAERTNAVIIVLTASLIAHRADAVVAMIAAKFVFIRHAIILVCYACSSEISGRTKSNFAYESAALPTELRRLCFCFL